MDSLTNDCYYYYNSTCLKGDRCQFRHEPSAMNCETVCRFWQKGKCMNQRCSFRHTATRNNRKMTPYYRKNQPRCLRKQNYSQQENLRLSPPEKQESGRDCITKSTHIKQWKRKRAGINLVTSFYAHKNTRLEPKCNTEASRLDNNRGSDLRAKILSKRAHRGSRADANFRVLTLDELRRNKRPQTKDHYSDMEETATASVYPSRDISAGATLIVRKFKSGRVAEDSGDASEASIQAKQKSCKSNFNFHKYRAVCGDKVTVTFNTKINSEYNGDTSLEPVTVSHTVIKAPTQIWEKYKSPEDDTCSYSIPKKMSLVYDCLPLKQTQNGLRNAGDGKNFLASESNRNEKDCFDQTSQIMFDTELKPRIRQNKRKNTDDTVGPPTKRSRLLPPTAEVTPQVNGSSNLSKLNGKSYFNSGNSGCFGIGQPVTDISEETFKSWSVLQMNTTSSISVSTAGCGGAQSTDPSSRTTTELITSELSGKGPDSSLNGLGNVRYFTHTSKSQSSERLESTSSEKCVLEDKTKELPISRTELGDTNTDEEMLLALDDDEDCIFITLDTEDDILLQTT